MTNFLFVYGTLRHGQNNEMSDFLKQHSSYESLGQFQGKLYQVDYYPGAVESTNSDDSVIGDIYRLNDVETVLTKLDEYEEAPTEYQRVERQIKSSKGEILNCWIYLYNEDTSSLKQIVTGDFLCPQTSTT